MYTRTLTRLMALETAANEVREADRLVVAVLEELEATYTWPPQERERHDVLRRWYWTAFDRLQAAQSRLLLTAVEA